MIEFWSARQDISSAEPTTIATPFIHGRLVWPVSSACLRNSGETARRICRLAPFRVDRHSAGQKTATCHHGRGCRRFGRGFHRCDRVIGGLVSSGGSCPVVVTVRLQRVRRFVLAVYLDIREISLKNSLRFLGAEFPRGSIERACGRGAWVWDANPRVPVRLVGTLEGPRVRRTPMRSGGRRSRPDGERTPSAGRARVGRTFEGLLGPSGSIGRSRPACPRNRAGGTAEDRSGGRGQNGRRDGGKREATPISARHQFPRTPTARERPGSQSSRRSSSRACASRRSSWSRARASGDSASTRRLTSADNGPNFFSICRRAARRSPCSMPSSMPRS